MIRLVLLCIFTTFLWLASSAQGFAIGTNTPDASAIMELESTDKGILIPRLTVSERNAIAGLGAAQEGLLIFNATSNQFNFWDGAAWVIIPGVAAPSWLHSGNSGTVDGTDFIGTIDDVPFNIRVFDEKAGRINSTGQTFYGYQSGNANTAASNTGIGFQVLLNNIDGDFNLALGNQSLYNNASGSNNIGIGYQALYTITANGDNLALGNQALYSNTTGRFNISIGNNALRANTTALGNIAIGHNALLSNTVGGQNIAIGRGALSGSISPSNNIAIGNNALSTTSGGFNTAVGNSALVANTTGTGNLAFGTSTLQSNTSGSSNVGMGGLVSNNTGSNNVAVGIIALAGNEDGNSNVAVGYQAATANVSGDNNTAIGRSALENNTTGSFNAALGYQSLEYNSTGSYNTAVGPYAFEQLTAGQANVAIGYSAGNLTGFSNTLDYTTFVGYMSRPDGSGQSNVIGIAGNQHLTFSGNNRVRVGNNAMTSIGGQVGWSTLSDERIKENVEDNVKGLDFILKLKPVTYNYSSEKSYEVQGSTIKEDWKGKYAIDSMRFSGFMAQEVEQAAKEAGFNFGGVDKPQNNDGLWGLRYSEFTVPLVKAVQELNKKDETLQITINELTNSNESLKKLVEMLLEKDSISEALILQLQQDMEKLKEQKK
jgi:hypothetical protein